VLPNEPRRVQEKIAELAFEAYEVSSACLKPQPLLDLVCSGRMTGLSVHLGESVCAVASVVEGSVKEVFDLPMSGCELDRFALEEIQKMGWVFPPDRELELARSIKENTCYVAINPFGEGEKFACGNQCAKYFELPNGSVVTMEKLRWTIPEALFDPSLAGKEGPGLSAVIRRALESSACLSSKDELQKNIVLAGGNSLFENFRERVEADFNCSTHPTTKFVFMPERGDASWIGGSVMSCLYSFSTMLSTKDQYLELGPRAIFLPDEFENV
jgi:actin